MPEQGDWYARQMYLQGDPAIRLSRAERTAIRRKFGFMEIDNLWKAERWEPEALMDLYVKAGAKYFVALANHHDNFDAYDSKHHAWNSVRVGPKKDIVGTWAQLARAARAALRRDQSLGARLALVSDGLRLRPRRAARRRPLRRVHAHERGRQGQMVGGPRPAGALHRPEPGHARRHHRRSRTPTPGTPSTIASGPKIRRPHNPDFVERWFLRCQDLIDKYQPDLLYFDDTELPLGQAGLDIAAHFYNANIQRHAAGSRPC